MFLPPSGNPLSEADLLIARQGPAIYVTRVILNNEAVVRLAFLEQTRDGPIFRVAVAMPHQVAIEMANMLKRSLADIEADLERFKEETEAAQKEGKHG